VQSNGPIPPSSTSISTKPKPSRIRSRPPSFRNGKKLPKSTAKAKGVWISNEKGKGEQSLAKPNAACRSTLRVRENTLVTCDGDESDNESEEDYVPPTDSDEESDNADDEIEEDTRELLLENYVDSGWEPFRQCEEIYEDDGGFLSRIYKNGHVYDDAEMGKIRLKSWQLFVDKDHFKDVLRDYCIQEGFALVVKKADNERYTAECADIRCNGRIHASKLADEHTWAIKNILWAASKLLEDIRACPDVKGSYMNELLSDRYGITMATSTLYKMREKALQIVQGGHDESYSYLVAYCEMLK
ncbi:hypothetical protein RDABS01_016840, partial [Bienertia sinuspersici]